MSLCNVGPCSILELILSRGQLDALVTKLLLMTCWTQMLPYTDHPLLEAADTSDPRAGCLTASFSQWKPRCCFLWKTHTHCYIQRTERVKDMQGSPTEMCHGCSVQLEIIWYVPVTLDVWWHRQPHVLSGSVLSSAWPAGTVRCPICMDFYPQVRTHLIVIFPALWEGNGTEGELHNPAGWCGMLWAAGLKHLLWSSRS